MAGPHLMTMMSSYGEQLREKKRKKDMAESFAEDGDYKLRGRKLILEWGQDED